MRANGPPAEAGSICRVYFALYLPAGGSGGKEISHGVSAAAVRAFRCTNGHIFATSIVVIKAHTVTS